MAWSLLQRLGAYSSDSDRTAHASYAFTSSKHRVGPDNYYLNQLKVNVDGVQQQFLLVKIFTLITIDMKKDKGWLMLRKETYRFLQGFRGLQWRLGLGDSLCRAQLQDIEM